VFVLHRAVNIPAAVQPRRQRKLVHSRSEQEPDQGVRLHSTVIGTSAAASATTQHQLLFARKRLGVESGHEILRRMISGV